MSAIKEVLHLVREQGDRINGAANRALFRSFLGATDRVRIYKQLIVQLKNNIGLEEAIAELYVGAARRDQSIEKNRDFQMQLREILAERPPQVPAQLMQHILRTLPSGKGLSDGLRGWVTEQEVSMIRTGEESGKVPEGLKRTIFALQTRQLMTKRLMAALTTPVLLVFGIFAALLANGLFLAPMLIDLMPLDRWHGATRALIIVGLWFKSWSILLCVAFVSVMVWMIWSLTNVTGPIRDRLDKFPPWSLYRMFTGSVFLLNFTMHLSSGRPEAEALLHMAQGASKYLTERLTHTLRGLGRGKNIGEALHFTGHHFPDDDTIGFMRGLAGRSGFKEALEGSIEEWLDQNLDAIVRLANFLRTILILAGVGVLVWMFMGVYGMSQIAKGMRN